MPHRTFDFCALQFLNQWLEHEEIFCDDLHSDCAGKQLGALDKAGAYFGIARTLPTKYDTKKNLPRYQPILEVLNGLKEAMPNNVERVVDDAQKQISAEYGGRSVLSATTKFLWLKLKSPIRIYDSQACNALKTKKNDFSAFNTRFSAYFRARAHEIDQACANLKSVVSYTADPTMSASTVDTLANKQWFKERALDIYLWNQ